MFFVYEFLGLNYLNQAIRSWETALDSIENAAYMQSQTLALPVIFNFNLECRNKV